MEASPEPAEPSGSDDKRKPAGTDWSGVTQWTGVGLTASGILTTAVGGGLVMGSGFLAWFLVPSTPSNQWTGGEACAFLSAVLFAILGTPIGVLLAVFGLGLTMPGGMMWFAVWFGKARAARDEAWKEGIED